MKGGGVGHLSVGLGKNLTLKMKNLLIFMEEALKLPSRPPVGLPVCMKFGAANPTVTSSFGTTVKRTNGEEPY